MTYPSWDSNRFLILMAKLFHEQINGQKHIEKSDKMPSETGKDLARGADQLPKRN